MHQKILLTHSSQNSVIFGPLTNPYKKLCHINGNFLVSCKIVNCDECKNNDKKINEIHNRYMLGVYIVLDKSVKIIEFSESIYLYIQQIYKTIKNIDMNKTIFELSPGYCRVISQENITIKERFLISDLEVSELENELTFLSIPSVNPTIIPAIEEILVQKISGGFCRHCGQFDDYAEQGVDGKVTCWRCVDVC
ncbi:MAG TPA: hypothetical protein VMX17_07980 [Candidatus Glassbacteria bacterium]|nr:hypothetical protein [Candidatus Glassbacteria bacterium]